MPKATFIKNGPIQLEPGVEICDSAGQVISVAEGKPVFLCRCGMSANKPFCDGAHRKNGFESEIKAA